MPRRRGYRTRRFSGGFKKRRRTRKKRRGTSRTITVARGGGRM